MAKTALLKRDKDYRWTPELEDRFLDALAKRCNVAAACRAIGIPRSTAYFKRSEDDAFAERWETAIRIGVARFEDHAIRRATTGWVEPVFHEGVICGYKRKFSDQLLVAVLAAHDPRYRREAPVTVNNTVNTINVLEDANERARQRAAAIREQRPAVIEHTATRQVPG